MMMEKKTKERGNQPSLRPKTRKKIAAIPITNWIPEQEPSMISGESEGKKGGRSPSVQGKRVAGATRSTGGGGGGVGVGDWG